MIIRFKPRAWSICPTESDRDTANRILEVSRTIEAIAKDVRSRAQADEYEHVLRHMSHSVTSLSDTLDAILIVAVARAAERRPPSKTHVPLLSDPSQ
jgi:hypothetical protein